MTASRHATSRDGTRLALHETGTAAGPVVVAVHGYPDDHSVWDGVADALGDQYRIIAYDVRGSGASDKPAERAAYRLSSLLDDLVAVLDEVGTERAVHLLGHDWGSVQLWPALTDPRLAGRIASFTSVSGPALDHTAVWLRDVRAHPLDTLRQVADSYYTVLFQLPKLPEFAIGAGLLDRAIGRRPHSDQRNGLNLYRANLRTNLRAVRRTSPARIDQPVQVIAPRGDRFISTRLALEAPRPFVADLHTHVVDGGHWVIRESPDVIADRVREFAATRPPRARAR